jgi:nucleoside-diphosphate-sugar epimerase
MRISSTPAENAAPALAPRVVLVGGAGFVGSVLARRLLDRRYRVTVVDALVYGDDGVRGLHSRPGFEVVKADLRDTDIIARSCRGAFGVVHLGGLVGDPACALDEQLTLDINLTATRTIAEAAREAGAGRFLFASSCAVYGASEELLDEESVLDPVSLYARTKVESEVVLRSLANDAFCPVALRFATFYGLSPRPRFDLAVNLLVAKAITEGEITIFGGDQWRPFVHVEDGTTAIISALEAPEAAVCGDVFNVGSDEQNHTFRQIAEMIERHVPGTQVVYAPAAETEANYRVSFAKIRERLGFRPAQSLDMAISEIGAALRSGAIGDYLETRYSNHKTLTQGRAVADLIRIDEAPAALSAPGRVVP